VTLRVLHVQRVAGVGGSERHLWSLLPALAERGVQIRMAIAAMAGADRFARELEQRGIEVVSWAAGPDLHPGFVTAIHREIRAFRPDLVHTHLIHADVHGQLAASFTRVPAVSSVHSTHSFYERQPYRMAAALSGRLARRTIAISHAVAAMLRATGVVPADRIRVIHYGIDLDGWGQEQARSVTRRQLDLATDEIVVGIASRLIPHKGHDVLIRAMATAQSRHPRLRLLIAGEGPLRVELERRADEALAPGTVRFLGFVEDIPGLMAACDILVFPSGAEFGEGFGLAALEAMAAGRPLVATAVGPLPELVDHGRTGFLVAPDQSQELVDALVALADDDATRARMGAEARIRAERSFSLATMAERTLDVYREVL
jgi:glycosyltransferase involved in cell wall biosynthesis